VKIEILRDIKKKWRLWCPNHQVCHSESKSKETKLKNMYAKVFTPSLKIINEKNMQVLGSSVFLNNISKLLLVLMLL
jgi:hypothetical protein